ncbi:hypothetical protein [Peristeroidobacter agariperforans]|uniref:hypothetical protein n=1 Tax=Peristeroidobacter agariperforans TaxID=268404 RepID=UPI00101E226D|nr:hypothetical protein [Peristeroidobacter agariperforans]
MITFALDATPTTVAIQDRCFTQCANVCYIAVTSSTETFVTRPNQRLLFLLLACYAVASLVHFVHNAEFLRDYPGLPASWSRGGVYLAWIGMTALGSIGALLVYRGRESIGLMLLAVYAVLGLDSLGHYVVAPLSAHSSTMNTTILLEVGAAALVLLEVARRFFGQALRRRGQIIR